MTDSAHGPQANGTSEISIASYLPGAIGRLVELHAGYYSKAWDFGLYFEARVAAELSEFLRRLDPARDGFWTAVRDGRVEGSIAIDAAKARTEGAHLRWFIVSEVLRGSGLGKRLMQEALGFCRRQGYRRVFFWTFQGLEAARYLYEQSGFRLVQQFEGEQWGKRVLEQRYELILP